MLFPHIFLLHLSSLLSLVFFVCSCWSPAHCVALYNSSLLRHSFFHLIPFSQFQLSILPFPQLRDPFFSLDALRDGRAAAVNLLPHQVLLMYKVEHIMVIEQERVMVHGIYILGP